MARENQGLQIALIVFVMLTIVLGVTTYLFFRQYEEADTRAQANLDKGQENARLATKNGEEASTLRRMLGVAETDEIETTFKDDMSKYAAGYPEDVRAYRPLMEKMAATIDEKNTALALADAKIQKLEDEFQVREANKQPQLDDFKQAREQASADLASERSKFNVDRKRVTDEAARLQANLQNADKKAADAVAEVSAKRKEAEARAENLVKINKRLADEHEVLTSQKFEVPDGEIRWVNQRTGTVWINLGRADELQPQVTFGVYPSDITDMSTGGKKANIEVTQVLGEHLAEAHVFDDDLIDPITPGDKIYTPIWMPGTKRHFALAGFVDLDEDGKSDMQVATELVAMNGGVVDCYVDDEGKRIGKMNVNTRYLVVGEKPTERSLPALTSAFSKMTEDAEQLGVQTIQLADLLQRMGWKNHTPIVRFGKGANPKDFRPKPAEGVQRKSTGTVSDVFKSRVPPARIPTSAY